VNAPRGRRAGGRGVAVETGSAAGISWPHIQHSVSALYIGRYLLGCAPPEQRDVELAEELARWAEDYRVDWTRAADGPQRGGSEVLAYRRSDDTHIRREDRKEETR
jgi:hypothetical protein